MKTNFLLIIILLATQISYGQKGSKDPCKPDETKIDKITKDTYEIWTEKLAGESIFKTDATTGKNDYNYFIHFWKTTNSNFFVINLAQSSTYVKEILGEDAIFSKGDKVQFGWQNGKPLELVVNEVQSSRKILTKTVTTSYFLIFYITEENIDSLKEYFTTDYITGVRIILSSGNIIEKEIKESKNVKIIEKAKCFFNAIGK